MKILIVVMIIICLLILMLSYALIILASEYDDRLRQIRKDMDDRMEDDGK